MYTIIELDRKLEKGDYSIPTPLCPQGNLERVKFGASAWPWKRSQRRNKPSELGVRLRAGAAQESGPMWLAPGVAAEPNQRVEIKPTTGVTHWHSRLHYPRRMPISCPSHGTGVGPSFHLSHLPSACRFPTKRAEEQLLGPSTGWVPSSLFSVASSVTQH